MAKPGLEMLEGSATPAHIAESLLEKKPWFSRAFNVCIDRDYCHRPVILDVSVAADGNVVACKLVDSDIRHTPTADLFCKTIETIRFRQEALPYRFRYTQVVNIFGYGGPEKCPNAYGTRETEPSYVSNCLQSHFSVLNSMRLRSINSLQTDPSLLEGNLVISFLIKPNGRVTNVKFDGSTVKDRYFLMEVAGLFRLMDFGPSTSKSYHRINAGLPFTGSVMDMGSTLAK